MSAHLLTGDPSLRGNVQRGLDVLASRLEPVIAAKLEPSLGGLPWTEVLNQLDVMKGRAARQHVAIDLQSQLRMLTERLGSLGHPFDDDRRNVSRLGSELRLVRNSLAHGGTFSPVDAWRAHDSSSRLLYVLGDIEGATACSMLRDELTPLLPGSDTNTVVGAVEGVVPDVEQPAVEPEATPEAEAFEREYDTPTPAIGQERMPFEAWEVSVIGEAQILDTLRRKDSKEQVRALAAEIVDFEGPIHVDRLTGLIARSFGVGKLHAKRQKAIVHQLNQCDFVIDTDGFAWPESITPGSWREFRPSSDPLRMFLHVSPVELQNAFQFLKLRHPNASDEEIYRKVLRTFGRKRLTQAFRQHFGRASKQG